MQAFSLAIRKVFRYVFLCVAIMSVLWFLMPAYRAFLQSLIAGTLISIVNGAVLFSKTWRIGQFAVDPSVRPKGTGMLQRMLSAAFAVFLPVRFPEMFTLSGMLIGLFVVPLLSLPLVYRSLK